MIEVVQATSAHAGLMAPLLRSDDAEEARGMGYTPAEALTTSLDGSTEAYCALIDGVPAAMWGVVPRTLLSDCASLWMLGTDHVGRNPKMLLKISREFVDQMHTRYPVIEAWVLATYAKTVRWVLWLGFSLEERMVLQGGCQFHIYRRRR